MEEIEKALREKKVALDEKLAQINASREDTLRELAKVNAMIFAIDGPKPRVRTRDTTKDPKEGTVVRKIWDLVKSVDLPQDPAYFIRAGNGEYSENAARTSLRELYRTGRIGRLPKNGNTFVYGVKRHGVMFIDD